MRLKRFWWSGFLAGLFFAVAVGQPRVVVIQSGDQELRRSAYRLRLCPEELRDARIALEEAHKLAPSVVWDTRIADVARLWVRLEPGRAGSAIRDLIDELRHLAEKAQDPSDYHYLTSSMQSLLMPLRELDPESADKCLDEWPEPESAKATANRPGTIEQIRKEQLLSVVSRDVDQAVERLEVTEGGNVDIQLRNPVISQLYSAGREAEAEALLDDTLKSTPRFFNDPAMLRAVIDLFRLALDYFPDRAPVVMAQLAAVPEDLPGDRPIDLVIGTTRLSLSPKESLILGLVRGLTNRPDTLARVMQLAPALRAKLQPVGGLDAVLNLRYGNTQRPSARKVARESLAPKQSDSRVSPESVIELLQASQELCLRDPDAARRLRERASRLIASQSPLTLAAAQLYDQLLNYSVHCEGTVSRDLINQGNLLVGKLREQRNSGGEKMNPDRTRSTARVRDTVNPADQLEASLVAMTALENFPDAMQAANGLRHEKVQFLAYLKIANLLGNR